MAERNATFDNSAPVRTVSRRTCTAVFTALFSTVVAFAVVVSMAMKRSSRARHNHDQLGLICILGRSPNAAQPGGMPAGGYDV